MRSYQYNAGVALSLPFGSILGDVCNQPVLSFLVYLSSIRTSTGKCCEKSDVIAVVPVNVVFSNFNVAPAGCIAYTLLRVSYKTPNILRPASDFYRICSLVHSPKHVPLIGLQEPWIPNRRKPSMSGIPLGTVSANTPHFPHVPFSLSPVKSTTAALI